MWDEYRLLLKKNQPTETCYSLAFEQFLYLKNNRHRLIYTHMIQGWFLKERVIVHLHGEDAPTFLHALVTQDVLRTVRDALPQHAVFLTPQGKVLHDFIMLPDPHALGLWLDVARAAVEPLMKQFQRYRLRAKVQWQVRDDLALMAMPHEYAPVPDALMQVHDPRLAMLGWRAVVSYAHCEGMAPADPEYHAWRIAHGVIEAHCDAVEERFFPLELGYEALHAIDYRKGCYVGQEVTARTHYKATLRKGIAIIEAETPLCDQINALYLDGQERSCGEMLSHQGTIGLALVRYDAWREMQHTHAVMRVGAVPVTLRLPEWGALPMHDPHG